MGFLECDLENIIYLSVNNTLRTRGLKIIDGKKFRQLRVGNYGIINLITIERPCFNEGYVIEKGIITIYELKKDLINTSTLLQAIGYTKGIISYLQKRYQDYYEREYFDIRIVLIGKCIDKESPFIYIPDIFSNVFLYTYEYKIDGLHFKLEEGYSLVNENFTIKKHTK